jgi:hypothetical protein
MDRFDVSDFERIRGEIGEEKSQLTEGQLEELPYEQWEALAAVSSFNLPTGGKLFEFMTRHKLETITNATAMWIQEQIAARSRGDNAPLTAYMERMMDTGYQVFFEEDPRGFLIFNDEEEYSVGPSPLNQSPTSTKQPKEGHKSLVALTVSCSYITESKFSVYEGFAKATDIDLPEKFTVKGVQQYVAVLQKVSVNFSYIPAKAEGNAYLDYIDREFLLMKDSLFYNLQDVAWRLFYPSRIQKKECDKSLTLQKRVIQVNEKEIEKELWVMKAPFPRKRLNWPKVSYIQAMKYLAASRAFRGKDTKGLSALTAGYQVGGLPSKEAKRVVTALRLALPFMLKGRKVELVLSSMGDMAGIERGLSKYALGTRHLLQYRMSAEEKAKVPKEWKDRVTVVPVPDAVLLLMSGTSSVSAKKDDEVQNLSYLAYKELVEAHRLSSNKQVVRDEADQELVDAMKLLDEHCDVKEDERPPDDVPATEDVSSEIQRDFILYMKVQSDGIFAEQNVYPAKSSHALDAFVSNLQLNEAYVSRNEGLRLRALKPTNPQEFLNMVMRHNYERNTAFLYPMNWCDYVMNFWIPRPRTHVARLEFEVEGDEEIEELPTGQVLREVDEEGETED